MHQGNEMEHIHVQRQTYQRDFIFTALCALQFEFLVTSLKQHHVTLQRRNKTFSLEMKSEINKQ